MDGVHLVYVCLLLSVKDIEEEKLCAAYAKTLGWSDYILGALVFSIKFEHGSAKDGIGAMLMFLFVIY